MHVTRIELGTIVSALTCVFAFFHQLPLSIGFAVIGALLLGLLPERQRLDRKAQQRGIRRFGLFTMWIGLCFSIAIFVHDFLLTQDVYFPALIATLAVAAAGGSLVRTKKLL